MTEKVSILGLFSGGPADGQRQRVRVRTDRRSAAVLVPAVSQVHVYHGRHEAGDTVVGLRYQSAVDSERLQQLLKERAAS